jgi:hypothetical protein
MEPHAWIREVIADKEHHFSRYQLNLGSPEIDLLVHAPVDATGDMVKASQPETLALLAWAANSRRTRFKRIYFWSAETGIVLLAPTEVDLPTPNFDFSKGYPTNGFLMSSAGPFATTYPGDPPREYDFGVVEPEVILVPPTSAEFRKRHPDFSKKHLRCKVIASETEAKILLERV